MASPESPHSPVDQFYVLKQGGMHGPFTREELRERFSGGHLDMEDFVQMEGVPIWQPLARILGNEDTVPHGAIAPDWKSLLTWAWLRLRYDLDEQSVVAGSVCLGIGLIALFLSRWTFVFWLPWMMAALLAALALWQRRRMVAGGLMLAAAIGLPLVFLALGSKSQPVTPVVVEEKGEPPVVAVAPPRATPPPEPQIEVEPPAPRDPASVPAGPTTPLMERAR